MNWTEDQVAELLRLNREGYSASGIAQRLNAQRVLMAGQYVTRSAVIGKLSRRGASLTRKWGQNNSAPKQCRPKTSARLISVPLPPIPLDEPAYLGPINDFPGSGCKWIKGEPGFTDWQCCSQPVQEPSPYCPFHHARCFSKIATAHSRDKFRSPNSAEAKAA